MQRKIMHLTRIRPHAALLLAALLIAAMAIHGPISQLANYHAFADQRMLSGIPHAGDVLSNLGFLFAAAWGAWRTRGKASAAQAVFLASLALTAAGSTWYHLAPDNARLVWDRLPIALACGALIASALPRQRLALPMLLMGAVLSVCWWVASGDLRPYLLLQLASLVLIPVLQWQQGAPVAQRRAFGLAVLLYVLAKLCEVGDHTLFEALGVVSGHTLKHLLAALAALTLASQFNGPR
jgi:predicted membrane channel-forming protein YqfA (hemolysin III family)